MKRTKSYLVTHLASQSLLAKIEIMHLNLQGNRCIMWGSCKAANIIFSLQTINGDFITLHALDNHPFTSRKHGKKEPQSFSHYGFFDHPNMQSLNNCRFVVLGFTTTILRFWGYVIHHWKGIFKTFLAVY